MSGFSTDSAIATESVEIPVDWHSNNVSSGNNSLKESSTVDPLNANSISTQETGSFAINETSTQDTLVNSNIFAPSNGSTEEGSNDQLIDDVRETTATENSIGSKLAQDADELTVSSDFATTTKQPTIGKYNDKFMNYL